MHALTISLLGTPTISVDNVIISDWPSQAAVAVVAYAAMANEPVARTTLIDMIWPESEPKQASSNLRTILTRLRRALGDGFIVERKTVALAPNAQVDVVQFAQLTEPDATIEQLKLAATLYNGAFMTGFQLRNGYPFEEWQLLQREKWERRYSRALERLVTDALEVGAFAAGERYAHQWVAQDPLHEQATQRLMWLQLRQGKRGAALQSYERLATVLRDELAVEPLGESRKVWERARRSAEIGANNLPPANTPFFGRNKEIHALIQQLTTTRLTTLQGMGGIGKTRLAQAVGRTILAEQRGRFLDGVWFVSLVAVESADELFQRIVGSLQIPVRGNRPIRDQLQSYLQKREMLLILDNFEQLANDDAVIGWLSTLLREAADVTFLVTSRVQLDLYEERIFRLEGLPTDEQEDAPAVRLFVERARGRAPKSALAERQPLIEICQWLEGVPLAIELAASWVDQLSPNAIHAMIRDEREQLQTRYRNIPARQRSLAAVFEHSWRLLSADLQQIYAQLCYFPDTFDVAAAQAIVGAGRKVLQRLVGHSLLQQQSAERYSVHPLLREYGLAKLAEPVAETFAAHYLTWLVDVHQHNLETGEDRINDDVPNVRLAWSTGTTLNCELAAIKAIGSYWRLRGWYDEALVMVKTRLASPDRLMQVRTRNELGHTYFRQGNYDEGDSVMQEALAMTVGEVSAERAHALQISAQLAMRRSALPQATAQMEEAVAIHRQLENIPLLAQALGQLVQAKGYYGESDDAHFAEALSLPTHPTLRTQLLEQAGRNEIASGQYSKAIETFVACERLHSQRNYTPGAASARLNQGIALTYESEWERATITLAEALRWFETNDEKLGIGLIYLHQGMVAEGMRDLDVARLRYQNAVDLLEEMGNSFASALANAHLAGCLAQREHPDAPSLLVAALKRLHAVNSPSLLSTNSAPITVGLAHLGYSDLALLLCGFSLDKAYTEAFARRTLIALCEKLGSNGANVKRLLAEGAGLSAKQLIGRIESHLSDARPNSARG